MCNVQIGRVRLRGKGRICLLGWRPHDCIAEITSATFIGTVYQTTHRTRKPQKKKKNVTSRMPEWFVLHMDLWLGIHTTHSTNKQETAICGLSFVCITASSFSLPTFTNHVKWQTDTCKLTGLHVILTFHAALHTPQPVDSTIRMLPHIYQVWCIQTSGHVGV